MLGRMVRNLKPELSKAAYVSYQTVVRPRLVDLFWWNFHEDVVPGRW
jgi:hypothetical protein